MPKLVPEEPGKRGEAIDCPINLSVQSLRERGRKREKPQDRSAARRRVPTHGGAASIGSLKGAWQFFITKSILSDPSSKLLCFSYARNVAIRSATGYCDIQQLSYINSSSTSRAKSNRMSTRICGDDARRRPASYTVIVSATQPDTAPPTPRPVSGPDSFCQSS